MLISNYLSKIEGKNFLKDLRYIAPISECIVDLFGNQQGAFLPTFRYSLQNLILLNIF
jgi:hypothetical protein